MIPRRTQSARLVVALLLLSSTTWASRPAISPEEYRARRATVLSRMDSSSIAVFRANDTDQRNGDVNYRYRQNSNFLYLTGCDEWGATLVLVPSGLTLKDNRIVREILFVTGGSSQWTGDRLGVEGAMKELGFGAEGTLSEALPHEEFSEVFARAIAGRKTLYYAHSLPEVVNDPVSGKRFVTSREIRNELKAKYPELELKNLNSVLSEMRSIKSPAEIALLQAAIDATTAAQIEAFKSCEPGMKEFELQAVIEYCFARLGAEYTGFPSIVGSGPNSQILHYEANRREMLDGDVVLMDIGAEFGGYSADVTRTIPVNGTFSEAQRAIYAIVLEAEEAAIREMVVGASANAAQKKAYEVLAQGLMELGIINDAKGLSKYCPHGVSHPIGLEVHDVGVMGAPLKAGMVLTIEPGLYIPAGSPCDERYWNVGIRIEDDVLVTTEGPKVLSLQAPRSMEEIERVMKKKGIGNQPVGDR